MHTPANPKIILADWLSHPFYTSATVLAIDVGLEGIGVCVRKGREIVYAKTWQYDIPEAARLESRRSKRSQRHCWANRKTRLLRLKALFEKHGLPWLDNKSQAVLHSDPFILRHRAVTKKLASKEALSLAIRHCVAHRGYDYEYFNDEGAYPWGDETEFKKVQSQLKNLWLTATDASKAQKDSLAFEEWTDVQRAEFKEFLTQRTGGPEILEQRLARHAAGSSSHTRARAKGEAFPRKFVWEHLEKIISRHSDLIQDSEGFLSALAARPVDAESKAKSIFWFHRKTKAEMVAHFEKKKARCAASVWLGLGDHPVAKGDHPAIRRFQLLEFLSTRQVELVSGKTKKFAGVVQRRPVGPEITHFLINWLDANPKARILRDCESAFDELNRRVEELHGAVLMSHKGKQKSDLNGYFLKQLRDILAPAISTRAGNARLSAAAAEKLFAISTARGFAPDHVVESLQAFYEFRRRPEMDLYGLYPQVEFLMGQRVRKAKTRNGKKRGDVACEGRIQRLFRQISPELNGVLVPDYCIIETARDLPRNLLQKAEREKLIRENQERREKLFRQYGLESGAKGSAKQRVELFDQQNGKCPFTGADLGAPLNDDLEVEHLFPQSRGGLSVNENLVLTFRAINAEKGERTPKEYAAVRGVSFEQILAHSVRMRWGKRKREIFEWDSEEFPDFGNTTRVAQLAKQLWNEIADWIGINSISDLTHRENERARRIGTPTGFFTAACRRAWELPVKDRTDLTHHLVDAIILAHIPPREGQNYVRNGGIFQPFIDPRSRRSTLSVLPVGPDPAFVARLVAIDAIECPIEKHRSSSRSRSLHDTTMWSVQEDGSLLQRTALEDMRKEIDGEKLRSLLLSSGIPETRKLKDGTEIQLIPPTASLQKWILSDGPEPLKLLDGTPVLRVKKLGKKGSLKEDPIGFTGRRGKEQSLHAIKAIIGNWDALELWRAWDEKKKRWAYYKQLVPSASVLQALKQLGISWRKAQKTEWKTGVGPRDKSFRQEIAGELPPYATRAIHPITGNPVVIRKGDTFLVGFNHAGKLAKRGEPVAHKKWVGVASILKAGAGRMELKDILSDQKLGEAPMSVEDIAYFAGLPNPDDSSSYPRQREPRSSSPSREADFRLQ